jgi:fumarate hydratase class II
MGTVRVPESAYWGAQTQRAYEHFAIGDERFPPAFIHAYALVKQAAAEANGALGELSAERAAWIASAAQEVIEGAFDAHFPLRVWQTGSGTQTNMNLNEVIANRANELAGGARGNVRSPNPSAGPFDVSE